MKLCCRCKIEKPTSEFSLSKRNKSGLRSECKNCQKLVYQQKSEYYKEKRKERYSINSEKELIRNKKYYQNNKSEIIEKLKIKKRNDYLLRVSSNMRSRISQFVKTTKTHKDNKTLIMLGIDLDGLKIFLEGKFTTGMCWENYGEWHIDHIVPLNSAKTSSDLSSLCHYTNLQPLWAKDNLSKGSKII